MTRCAVVAFTLIVAGCAQSPSANDAGPMASSPPQAERNVLEAGECRFTISRASSSPDVFKSRSNPRVVLTWELPGNRGLSELSLDITCTSRQAMDDAAMNALFDPRTTTREELEASGAMDSPINEGKRNFTPYPVDTKDNFGAAYTIDQDTGDEESRTRALIFCIGSRNKPELLLCGDGLTKRLIFPGSDVTEQALQHLKSIEFVD